MKLFPVILTILTITFLNSCGTISIQQRIQTKEDDWLVANSNLLKQNISRSDSELAPPFTKIWDFNADAGFPANAMTLSDAILFSSTLRGEIYAVDVSTGKRLGNISKFGGPSYSAPAIYKNSIIFTVDGNKNYSVVKYDITRGVYTWRYNAGFVRSSPVVNGNNIYTASKDGKVYSINLTTGIAEWIFTPQGSSFFNSPTVSDSKIFIGNTNGKFYCISKADGSPVWEKQFEKPFYCDASVYNGVIYTGCDDGLFRAISEEGITLWEKDLGTRFESSSTFYEDKIITTGIDGRVYAMNLSNGEIIWTFQTAGAITASPVSHGSLIFVGSFDRNFYCLDVNNGTVLWKFQTGGRVKTTAVIWNDFIFAASEDRNIYCFK